MELYKGIKGFHDLVFVHIPPDPSADLRVCSTLASGEDVVAVPGGDNAYVRGADAGAAHGAGRNGDLQFCLGLFSPRKMGKDLSAQRLSVNEAEFAIIPADTDPRDRESAGGFKFCPQGGQRFLDLIQQ